MKWKKISRSSNKVTYSLEEWISPVIVTVVTNPLDNSTSIFIACEYITVHYLNGNVQLYTDNSPIRLDDLLELGESLATEFKVGLPLSLFDKYTTEEWWGIEREMDLDMEVPPDLNKKMDNLIDSLLQNTKKVEHRL